MTVLKHKIFAYITNNARLLVFSHPGSPEAGIQVPAGTLRPGETPEEGVMREAREETGLETLQLLRHLGSCDHFVPKRDEMHRRHFFHILFEGSPPERWEHYERHADDGSPPILFEFFWVALAGGIPLLASGHDHMLPTLLKYGSGRA